MVLSKNDEERIALLKEKYGVVSNTELIRLLLALVVEKEKEDMRHYHYKPCDDCYHGTWTEFTPPSCKCLCHIKVNA